MNDVSLIMLLVGGLIVLDVLALRFGRDSRDLMRPDSSHRSGRLRAALRDGEHLPQRSDGSGSPRA